MTPTATALPEGARLLHVGIPKTGTTALQRTAAARRGELLAAGVCYPGRTVNHREAVCALLGRTVGWSGAGGRVPPLASWQRLAAEVRRHPGRSLVSHEFAAEATDDQAARFAAELGDQLHVVITLRGFAHLLGSSWQQYVKTGRRKSYRRWLRQVLADDPPPAAAGFYRRNDQGAIVRRWVRTVGPGRTVVVVADKARPTLLSDAFEDLLALPRGLLRADPADGFATNRSLSWPEAELVRRLNRLVAKPVLDWPAYDGLVRSGGVARLLHARHPGPTEPAIGLPAWAAERATATARRYAAEIAASGAVVVGDLDVLAAAVPPDLVRLSPPRTVPTDAAAELAAGIAAAALGRPGPVPDDDAEDPGAPGQGLLAAGRRLSAVPTGHLVAALGVRAASSLRRLGPAAVSGRASPAARP